MYKKYIKKYSGDKIVVYNHDEKMFWSNLKL